MGRPRGALLRGAAVAVGTATVAGATWAGPPASADVEVPAVGPALVGQTCWKPSTARVTATPVARSMLGLEPVWHLTRGRGVTVAVISTGVDSRFTAALSDVVLAAPPLPGAGPADRDCVGFGTYLASVVAARPVVGSAVVGLAPQARILSVRATDDRGTTSASLLASAVDVAVRSGARILLVGAGVPAPTPELATAVQRAHQAGALVVAPSELPVEAGRDPVPAYPGGFDTVLAVGAVDAGLQRVSPSAGARVDLTAPGVGVLGVGPGADGAVASTGSAAAAAEVAGAAALVASYHPELDGRGLASRLLRTAYAPVAGAGLVDPLAAVTAMSPDDRTSGPAAPAVPLAAMEPEPRFSVDLAWQLLGATGLVGFLVLACGRVLSRRERSAPGRSGDG